MSNDFRISVSPKDETIIITTNQKTGIKLTYLLDRIDVFVSSFGKYKVECFYLTPRASSSFDFKTNVPYNLFMP